MYLSKKSLNRHTKYLLRNEKLSHIFNGYLGVIKKSLEWEVMKKYGIHMNNFDKWLNLKFVRFSHKSAILFNFFEECLVFICLQNISWPSDKIKFMTTWIYFMKNLQYLISCIKSKKTDLYVQMWCVNKNSFWIF